ncbi:helix-turn-helix domain-containing protein [Marinivivus vitaminiproducens]|uniref:helix-turn-helix domain-containing protein n=1 Tax=Marinivivus vitaminiproducens TaxID=3035935 RepID=UPI0027A16927|nr:helix-turn-helix transcriptional regulator [Geminicoccaceae bacterium SCSIO 64248]
MNDDFELIEGSGNVYRDLAMPDSEIRQLRAVLGAWIARSLDEQGLTLAQAHAKTGFAAADFSRIRKAHLDRFTLDRLMRMLAALGEDYEVTIRHRRYGDGLEAA